MSDLFDMPEAKLNIIPEAKLNIIIPEVIPKVIPEIQINITPELTRILDNIKYFDSIPPIVQKSQEWLDMRKNLVPASESGYLLGVKGVGTLISYISNKVGISTRQELLQYMPSIQHGNMFEDVSRIIYETRHNVIVKEYGLIKSRNDPILSASPDGVVIHSNNANNNANNNTNNNANNNANNNNSRVGRLLEIKNPYKYDDTETIKDEYAIQIQQQLYVLETAECDFIKTNIVGLTVNDETIKNGFKPYNNTSPDDMLNDVYIYDGVSGGISGGVSNPGIHNKNIPLLNLNSKGMEKGVLISYKDNITNNINIIIYPIMIEYKKDEIELWIKTNLEMIKTKTAINSDINSNIYRKTIPQIQYWYVARYYEKTVKYDSVLFEQNYIIRLHLIWDLITYIRNIRDTYDLENADTLTSVCGLDIIKQFINTQLRTILDKPSKFYSSIGNFNNICTLLKSTLKLKPLLVIDDEYTQQETIKEEKRNSKRKNNNNNNYILDF